MTISRHFSLKNPPGTSQREPAEAKKHLQVQNYEGGYVFKANDWEILDRFLKLGSSGGTFYAGERKLTIEAAEVVLRCLFHDFRRTIDRIVEISDRGENVKQESVIFALALACSVKHGDHKKDTSDPNDPLRLCRQYALNAANKVLRTGSHWLMFQEIVKHQRGWGYGLRRLVNEWYQKARPIDQVMFQALKYQNRNNWSHRDVLRLGHPKPINKRNSNSFGFIVKPDKVELDNIPDLVSKVIELKTEPNPEKAAILIRNHRLPREVVPTDMLKHAVVWDALLEDMPLTATLRNLGRLTGLGLLSDGSEHVEEVVKKLTDVEYLAKSRLHPINILIGMRTYASGRGYKGKLQWSPVKKIVNALDEAFYVAFRNVIPMGLRVQVSIDVSGSMQGSRCAGSETITCHEAGAALALQFLKTEPEAHAVAFDTKTYNLQANKGTHLEELLESLSHWGGGTDCASPIIRAHRDRSKIDLFVMITDNITWAGETHVFEALDKYRNSLGIKSKFVMIPAAFNSFSIADPEDPLTLGVVGFDGSVPEAIRLFATGGA